MLTISINTTFFIHGHSCDIGTVSKSVYILLAFISMASFRRILPYVLSLELQPDSPYMKTPNPIPAPN